MEKQIVTSGKLLAGFVVFALALLLVANVSATSSSFGSIDRVEINGVDASSGTFAQFAGQRVPVLIVFDASVYAEDVRVKAWISGERENLFTSERFDVLEGNIYSRVVFVDMPSDLDETEEARSLEIVVESKSQGTADEMSIDLTVQRESYLLEVLDVDFSPEVKAGDTLTLDVVTKNIGRQDAEDTFVSARIPALGLDDRAYFGDLSSQDRGSDPGPERDDTVERRLFLRIPAGTPAGVYDVEVQAFNDDSITTLNRKVVVRAQSTDTVIVSGTASKTFAVGQEADYSITLVNAGDRVQVYELIPETSSGLTVNVEEPIVAIPAGSSRTVKVTAQADKAGDYNFAVNVNSDSALIKRQSFAAKVEGTNAFSGGNAGNTTVLLTVVLAIIFVVLLVVLIVLLTRKPQKSEEFGESYY